jgi:CBS domain containing-hemolysin-like protein
MQTALYIFAIIALVFVNGFFVAAEFALVGVRRSRIETLANAGELKAKRLLGLLDKLNAYLSASQLGITLASLALGWIGEPTVAHILEAPLSNLPEAWRHTVAFLIAYIIITTLHIVLGEQAPKLLGLERAEKVALAAALPMQIFYSLFSWPVRALDWASARTVRLFGLHPTAEHGTTYTEAEFRQLVEALHKSGQLEADKERLIKRILDFSDAEVREAMVPRLNVVALSLAATLVEAEETFCSSGYSRLPVFKDRLDELVGVIYLKDLVPCLKESAEEFELEKLLRPPVFVPATARLGNVLAQMQSSQSHMTFVVDEHGGIEGLVTLEDLLEEIVGEIYDEFDKEAREQIALDGETYILDGMLSMRDMNRHFNLHLPEEAGYKTLAGFMQAKSGRLLRQGESIEHQGSRFTVERVDRRRIRRVRFTPVARDSQPLASLLFPLVCMSVGLL